MSDVIPYSNLAEDPTTEAVVYWIDDREEAEGSEHTLHYGESDGDYTESVADDSPREVPELPSTYLYVVVITDLDPDTRYYAEIRDGDNALETCQWVTLPESLDSRDVTIAISSDWHKDVDGETYMNDPEDIDVIWDEDPDISLFAGDYLTGADDQSKEIAEEWIGIFRDYYRRYNDEELVHILAIPGNHEVGNHQWDGKLVESVSPDEGYIQFFYGHPRLLDPVGKNYGQVTIGDYAQVLALDTHSEYPPRVGDWLWIQDGVPFCIPFQHEGFVQMGERDSNDLRKNVRDSWFKKFYEADNVYFWQHGHVHTEGKTVPLKYTEDEPADDEYKELSDGYMVEAETLEDGIIGLGEGWRKDRSLRDEWYIDRVQGEQNFTIVELSDSDGPNMTVTVYDSEGETIDSDSFDGEYGELIEEPEPQPNRSEAAVFGDVELGDIKIGGS